MTPDISSRSGKSAALSKASRGCRLAVLTALGLALAAVWPAHAAAPAWWFDRGPLPESIPGVIKDVVPNQVQQADYAIANLGQLKNFARAARDEMLRKGMIFSNHPIDAMVDAWAVTTNASDYSAANLGQLKAVAKPFYDRLILVGLRPEGSYPWGGGSSRDYATANLGQLKAVFAFEVPDSQTKPYAAGVGKSALFWTFTLDGSGNVTQGILAGDQTLPYSLSLGAKFKDATSVTVQNGYITRGTLADLSDGNSYQNLRYGLTNGAYVTAAFKGGTEVRISASNYVTQGTLADSYSGQSWQNLYYGRVGAVYLQASFQGGTEIKCEQTTTGPPFYGRAVQGTLAADVASQTLNHAGISAAGAQYSGSFKAGTAIVFTGGYVSRGTLSEGGDQTLRYGSYTSTFYSSPFKGGTEVEFTYHGYGVGQVVSRGIVGSGGGSFNYGIYGSTPFSGAFKAGSEIQFALGYVTTGIVADAGDNFKYGNYGATQYSAAFQGNTQISFAANYVTEGTLRNALPHQDIRFGSYGSTHFTATFQSGSAIMFAGGDVSNGTLREGTDQSLRYGSYGATSYSGNFKAGSQIKFAAEYVKQGTVGASGSFNCNQYGSTFAAENFKESTEITFASGATGLVASGTLSDGADQSIIYGRYGATPYGGMFKGGSKITFTVGLVSAGIVGAAGGAYNYSGTGGTYVTAAFVPETEIAFLDNRVSKGTVLEQDLRYNATNTVRLQANSVVSFSGGFVPGGVLVDGTNQSLYYAASKTVTLQPGTSVTFGGAYVTAGTLLSGQNHSLDYSTNVPVSLKGGQKVQFVSGRVTGGMLAESPAGNQSLVCGSNTAFFKAGTSVIFANSKVTSGTLAEDSVLRYCEHNDYANVTMLAGTFVEFGTLYVTRGTLATNGLPQPLRYSGLPDRALVTLAKGTEVVFVNRLVTGGILLGDQTLAYGGTSGFDVKLQSGQRIGFSGGLVTGGILADGPGDIDQGVYYGSYAVSLKKGSDVSFAGGVLSSGILGSIDQPAYYRSGYWVNFQAGTVINFSGGFVARGTLASGAAQNLMYALLPSAQFIYLRGNTEVMFYNLLVARGVPDSNSTRDYGPSRSVNLIAGAPVTFAALNSIIYVTSGTANGAQTLLRASGMPKDVRDGSRLEFVSGYLTNVYDPVDGDDLPDEWEWETFGNLAQNNTTDFDGDGLTDLFEFRNGLDPKNPDENGNSILDGLEDADGDGLTNVQEQMFGTSMTDADSDKDGLSDADEINIHGTNPFLVDTDYDGVADDFDAFPFDPLLQRLSSAGGPPVIQLLTPANAVLQTP